MEPQQKIGKYSSKKYSENIKIQNTITGTKNLIECFTSILETNRDKNQWIRSMSVENIQTEARRT